MSKQRKLTHSFDHAFDGLSSAFRNEPNFRIHVCISLIVIIAALLLGSSAIEWLVLIATIFLVFIFELFNTAIEAIVDLVSPDIHPKAKIAKDVSAAAVLLSAVLAASIGAIIFIPKFIELTR